MVDRGKEDFFVEERSRRTREGGRWSYGEDTVSSWEDDGDGARLGRRRQEREEKEIGF